MDDKVLGIQHVLVTLCAAEYFVPIVDINKKDFQKAFSQIAVNDDIWDDVDEDGDFREVSSANGTNKKRIPKTKKRRQSPD